MKKVFAVYILIASILLNPVVLQVSADTKDGEYDELAVANIFGKTDVFELKAKASILMEADTGSILMENNSHEKLPIASVTKIMSMLLFMESINSGKISMDDMVTATEHACSMGGTQVWLDIGEQFTVRELLYAVAVGSANDATVAVAEHIAGSEEAFVHMMNEKAAELGMHDTNFLDSSGLTDENHYSSAYDIALMSRELITKHPEITEFTKQWIKIFREGRKDKEVMLSNTNKLVRFYEGTVGLKTGHTNKAGFCLSAVAQRGNLMLISVVLAEPDSNTRFAETRKLMDYGFANYETTLVNKKGENVQEVEIRKGLTTRVGAVYGDDVKLLVKKGEKGEIERRIELESGLSAPVKAGQRVGEAIYTIGEKEIGRAELVAENAVEKATFLKLFIRMMGEWFGLGRK